ncbi:hypothetical protein [Chryseobacterium sp. Tr-659]|uniref:hypothetical protein n=1 Tax=Chryseobacterium sp. Tr-659 TaxID=2608340 RepID=UPI00141F3B05|nr:hypothetical protein [Chryseobacterium sp. Tr-659]
MVFPAGLFLLYNRIFTDKILGIPLMYVKHGQPIFASTNIIHIFIYNFSKFKTVGIISS